MSPDKRYSMMICDTDFANAVHHAVNGDATALSTMLRDATRPLTIGERHRLADLADRCAELARGDIGGALGRRKVAAGNPKVLRAVEEYNRLVIGGMQKTKAKGEVAETHKVSVSTVENYLRITRDREKLLKEYAIK